MGGASRSIHHFLFARRRSGMGHPSLGRATENHRVGREPKDFVLGIVRPLVRDLVAEYRRHAFRESRTTRNAGGKCASDCLCRKCHFILGGRRDVADYGIKGSQMVVSRAGLVVVLFHEQLRAYYFTARQTCTRKCAAGSSKPGLGTVLLADLWISESPGAVLSRPSGMCFVVQIVPGPRKQVSPAEPTCFGRANPEAAEAGSVDVT